MNFFRQLRNLPHDKLLVLAKLCGGLSALVLLVLVLSGVAPGIPTSWRLAINAISNMDNPAAVVYWQTRLPTSGNQGSFGVYPGYTSCAQQNSDSGSYDPNCYANVNIAAASLESSDNSNETYGYWNETETGNATALAICNHNNNPDFITYDDPPHFSLTSPVPIVVQSGQALQLDWSCLPSQQIQSFYCGHQVQWAWGGPGAFEGQPGWATSSFTSSAPTITAVGDSETPSTGGQYHGSITVTPTGTAGAAVTYTVHCAGSASNPVGGTWSHDNSISIPVYIASSAISLTASPSTVLSGQTSTLTWAGRAVSACTLSGPGVTTTTYTLPVLSAGSYHVPAWTTWFGVLVEGGGGGGGGASQPGYGFGSAGGTGGQSSFSSSTTQIIGNGGTGGAGGTY